MTDLHDLHNWELKNQLHTQTELQEQTQQLLAGRPIDHYFHRALSSQPFLLLEPTKTNKKQQPLPNRIKNHIKH